MNKVRRKKIAKLTVKIALIIVNIRKSRTGKGILPRIIEFYTLKEEN